MRKIVEAHIRTTDNFCSRKLVNLKYFSYLEVKIAVRTKFFIQNPSVSAVFKTNFIYTFANVKLLTPSTY